VHRELKSTNRNVRNSRGPSRANSPGLWMLLGFIPGLLLAIYSYVDKYTDRHLPAKSPDTISFLSDTTKQYVSPPKTLKLETEKSYTSVFQQKPKPLNKPKNKGIKYSFFYDLKKRETIVSPQELKHDAKVAEKKSRAHLKNNKAATKKSKLKDKTNKVKRKRDVQPVLANFYLIQAGSFRNRMHATAHKKRLKKLGVKSKIETVQVKGGLWYRVSVGPFNHYSDIERNLQKLNENKINAIPVKIK